MAVPIRFEPDMSAVRKAIADIVREAGAARIGVPVQAAGTVSAVPGTTGGQPNAAAVFGASRAFVQGNFGGIDRFTAPGFSAPLGPGAATSSFFGTSPLSFSGAFAGIASPSFTPAQGPPITAGNAPHAETILAGGGAPSGAANANVMAGAAIAAATRARPSPRATEAIAAGGGGAGGAGFTMGGPASGGGQPGAALAILDPGGGRPGGGWTWGRGSAAGAAASAGAIIPVPVRRVNIPPPASAFVGDPSVGSYGPGVVNAGYSAAFRAGVSDWADEQFAAARVRGGGTVGGRAGMRAPGGGFFANNRFLGGQLWGLGGLYSVGTAIGGISHGLEASRQLAIDTALAGGNQRAELEATLQYRQSVVSGFGFIGHVVGYLNDPGGANETYIRSQLLSADSGERRAARQRTQFEFAQSMRNTIESAGIFNPLGKRLAQIGQEADKGMRDALYMRESRGAEDTKAIEAERATLESTREGRIMSRFRAAYPRAIVNEQQAGYDAIRTAVESEDNAAVATSRAQRTSTNQKLYDADRALVAGSRFAQEFAANREEGFRQTNVLIETTATKAEARALIANDPVSAAVARIRGQSNLAINAAIARAAPQSEMNQIISAAAAAESVPRAVALREFGFAAADLAGQGRVSHLILNRDPVGAQVAQARENAAAAARRQPGTIQGALTGALIMAGAENEVAVIRQQDADTKRYRKMQLQGDERALRLSIADRPLAAEAGRRRDAALLAAEQLRDEGDAANASRVLKNAGLEQEAFRKQVLRGFEAEEVDANRTAFGGPRSGENVEKLLASIDASAKQLAQSDRINGGAAVTSD